MENREFRELLARKTEEMNRILEDYLPEEAGPQKTVLEAMNYSVRAGGKRLRPMLMWETFLLCGGRAEDRPLVEPFLAAIEMIHTYSLVHDDLPAMDNDEYRRGRKTTWAVYGEAMGILAGDGLLNLAFETAAQAFESCGNTAQPARAPSADRDLLARAFGSHDGAAQDAPPARTAGAAYLPRAARALSVLARKAGVYGMIGGQTADVEAEGQEHPVTEEQLLYIHAHKTAALIQAAMTVGAILAGAGEEQVDLLEKCARNIGIAFQIQDDILDVVGDSAELGKPVGSDAQNGKQTYVTLKGLERAQADVEVLSEEAIRILDAFGDGHDFLRQLILELTHRRK